MEVRPGYKQTEAGIIPEGWDWKRLGDFASVGSGGTPSREQSAYWGGSIPWITTSQIDFGVITEAEQFITEEGLKNSAAKLLPPGTLLMALYGQGKTRGKVGVLGVHAATNQACASIALQDGISREFIFHSLTNQYEAIRNASNSGSQENLNGNIVRGISVAFPPLHEQRAIASALSDVDALLSGLDRLIAKKRDLKQATMQQLLTGQTRLPGFEGEWEEKLIGEFTDCTAGGTPSTRIAEYWGGKIRWMSSGELNLKCVYEVEGRVTEAGLSNSSTKVIPEKCVLIGLAGQGKTRGTVAMNYVELCTNQSIAAIFPNPSFVPEYLYYNLDARYDELREMSAGDGGRGGLNLTIIKAIPIPFPLVPEQTAIAAVLSDMDAELAALEARREKTRLLKQGMMQELLTGKTRLITPERDDA